MKKKVTGNTRLSPPIRSKNIFTDVYYFLLHGTGIKTKIRFSSTREKKEYSQRIMQRVGIDTDRYSVLNVHKIGVNAPVSHVFNELMIWNGDSTCWPNRIARVERINDRIEEIRILPFGWKKYPLGAKRGPLGFNYIPLFCLNALQIKQTPGTLDFDNARYLLYESYGGYPIGIFTMYVRSSIPELGETSQSQLFFMVSFNFYGKENNGKPNLINQIWERMHDRVTNNVLYRLKELCEWRFDKIKKTYPFL